MNIKKNDIVEIEITGMTAEGSGIGRYNGMAVFVASSAVGDRIKVKLIKVSKNYAIGKIEEILVPSTDRQTPDCAIFNKCGGCAYRHVTYTAELKYKRQRVIDAVERIGGFKDFEVDEIVGAENPDNYRNKAQIPIGTDKQGNVIMGFYAANSHRIIPHENCNLQPKIFSKVTSIVKKWIEENKLTPYNEITGKGKLRHVYIRYGEKTNELMVCIVVNGKGVGSEDKLCNMLSSQIAEIKSIAVNVNTEDTNVILGKECRTIYGKESISDILCGLKFDISPLSFYQVNRNQAERLYGIAKNYADMHKDEVLLDIYCGTGTIGLSMADSCKAVYGIEVIPDAVENAKQNALNNKIVNAEFICADAYEGAKRLTAKGIKSDVIIIDPPRKGSTPEVINLIVSLSPKRIVYVSCDPATLSRDLKLFNEFGYEPQKITPVDMFPRTSHVECVVLMTRKAE